MKYFIALILVQFVLSAQAKTCKVENYKDAIKCIKADASKRYAEGELPHSAGVTSRDKGKDLFELITGYLAPRYYVGVVQVHYDEDQLLYYTVNRGPRAKPILAAEFNMVDITYHAPELEKLLDTPGALEKALSLEIPLVGSMKDFHGE